MNQDIKLVIDELNQIEDADYIVIYSAVTLLETLGNKVAQQAAVIERLREVLWDTNKFIDQTYSDLIGSNSLESLAARYADTLSLPLSKALAIPTDSKQILADWMREQLGEPVNKVIHYDEAGCEHVIHLAKPLYKLPECLR